MSVEDDVFILFPSRLGQLCVLSCELQVAANLSTRLWQTTRLLCVSSSQFNFTHCRICHLSLTFLTPTKLGNDRRVVGEQFVSLHLQVINIILLQFVSALNAQNKPTHSERFPGWRTQQALSNDHQLSAKAAKALEGEEKKPIMRSAWSSSCSSSKMLTKLNLTLLGAISSCLCSLNSIQQIGRKWWLMVRRNLLCVCARRSVWPASCQLRSTRRPPCFLLILIDELSKDKSSNWHSPHWKLPLLLCAMIQQQVPKRGRSRSRLLLNWSSLMDFAKLFSASIRASSSQLFPFRKTTSGDLQESQVNRVIG